MEDILASVLGGKVDTISVSLAERPIQQPAEATQATTEPATEWFPPANPNIHPLNPISNEERAQWYAQQPPPMTLKEGLGAALQSEWSLPWLLGGKDFVPDKNHPPLTTERLAELTQGIPEDYWGAFYTATSTAHEEVIREETLRSMQVEADLERMGWKGTALRVAAAILDPVAIGATLATDGVMAPILYANKAGRIGRALGMGSSAAVANAGIEAMLAHAKPTGDVDNILFGALGGFALGGALGALRSAPVTGHLMPELVDRARRDLVEEATSVRPASLPELAAQPTRGMDTATPAPAGVSIQDIIGQATQAFDNAEGLLRTLDTAGARRAHGVDLPISERAEDIRLDLINAPYAPFGPLRADAVGQAMSSPHPMSRDGGARLGENSTGNMDHSVNRLGSASERQSLLFRTLDTQFQREVGSAFNRFAVENKLNWWGRQQGRNDFMEDVTRAIRDDLAEVSTHAREAADKVRGYFNKYLSDINEAGVGGFESVVPNRNYVNRIYSPAHLADLERKFFTTDLERMLSGSLRAANPEISEEVANRFARWHLKKVKGYGYGADLSANRALGGEDIDGLKELMEAELTRPGGSELTREDVDEILLPFLAEPQGGYARSRHRVLFDENFKMDIRTKDASATLPVAFTDLLNNNIEDLFRYYNRQMSGAIAMAKVGFPTRASFDTYINNLSKTAPDVSGLTAKQLEKDIKNLTFLRDSVLGMPHYRSGDGVDVRYSKWGERLRMWRDYNYIRVFNQGGFAQLPELGNILGEAGVVTALKAFPSFRALWRNFNTGEILDDTMAELEAVFGIGADAMRFHPRWDSHEMIPSLHTDPGMETALNVLGYGKRITNTISGMSAVHTFSQRWALLSFTQKFTDLAYDLTKIGDRRLHWAGLNKQQLDDISEQIRVYSTVEDGMLFNKKLRKVNLDAWTNKEAAENFRLSVYRMTRQAIQENDAGNMHRWFAHPLMQTVMQFRSFSTVAHSKQLLRGVHLAGVNRDGFDTGMAFMMTTLAASLVYMAQTYTKSIGRKDAQAYRDKMLTPEAIGKAAFQRSGWTAFTPMATDTMGKFLGADPLFLYRNTELGSSIFANPTEDFFNKAADAAGGTIQTLMGNKPYTKNTFDATARLLPFNNAIGLQNFFNWVSSDLPREYKK